MLRGATLFAIGIFARCAIMITLAVVQTAVGILATLARIVAPPIFFTSAIGVTQLIAGRVKIAEIIQATTAIRIPVNAAQIAMIVGAAPAIGITRRQNDIREEILFWAVLRVAVLVFRRWIQAIVLQRVLHS